MAGNKIPLMIPEIGNLLIGYSYDMTVSEQTSYENTFTEHPIEDPNRSFLMDHNRESPTKLTAQILISSIPVNFPDGIYRLSLFYEQLLDIRARQSVDPAALLDIFTGIRTHYNMAIQSVSVDRANETANLCTFNITFYEFRFARSPSLIQQPYLMEANNGPIGVLNRVLVNEADRMITEGLIVKRKPRLGRLAPIEGALLKGALTNIRGLF